jgi:hypothetical protein
MTNEDIYALLWKDGIQGIVEHGGIIVLDKSKGEDSKTQPIRTRLFLLNRESDRLSEEKLKIERNHYWESNAWDTKGQWTIRPKTDEELNEVEKREKVSKLDEINDKIQLNKDVNEAYVQLHHRYIAGRIKLPIDLREEHARVIKETFTERFIHSVPGEDGETLEWLSKVYLYDSGYTLANGYRIADVLGLSLEDMERLLDEDKFPPLKFARWVKENGFPVSRKAIEDADKNERSQISIRPEQPPSNPQVDKSTDEFFHATKAANAEAYQIAREYRNRKEDIPYGSIAERVMKNHFISLIKRETGVKSRNGQLELTKEWKTKREAIRGTLRDKFR